LTRINALCLRFINNIKSPTQCKTTGPITVQELIASESLLVGMVQRSAFKEDLRALKTKGSVAQRSKLLSLTPFLDARGIMRVGGRLRNSAMSFDKIHPILLPAKHTFTWLVIRHEHHKQLHAGAQATLAAIRTKYWPLSARSNVKKCIRTCVTCFKAAPRSSQAIMGDLPSCRVKPAKPFETTGIDYCGPILIKSGRLRNAKRIKAYIAIFVCLCTKAVHIELVSDLSTEAFLSALKRFIARRGKITRIYSDNGTNFRGAANALKELYQLLHSRHCQETIDKGLKEDHIEWHFIPPHAPHFGGIWEAAVKSAKIHLRRTVGDSVLDFEEMATVLT